MESIDIRGMTIGDYDKVFALLKQTPGIVLRTSDSREATAGYLHRNPGLSLVAMHKERIAGCILCGHDGRRGYIQHLAVHSSFQKRGIGTALVEHCLALLKLMGIEKVHVDVVGGNETGHRFWANRGWTKRGDISRYSFINSEDPNA